MPLCEPFPTDGGPANPLQSNYFTNYWSVFLENEYFQMQRHKAEVLGLLGDWAMRKMKSRLKDDDNADGFRIIVKVGPPWPAIATAPALPIIQRDWIWLESIIQDMKASLPAPRTVSNKQLVDAILSYLKTRWEDQLSSDSDEEQDIPSYILKQKEKERRRGDLGATHQPTNVNSLRFELMNSFTDTFARDPLERLISSMPNFNSPSSTMTTSTTVRNTSVPISLPTPQQTTSVPITIASSTSPGAGIGSGLKASTSIPGMPVLSGIAVSSARVPWNSPGNTPPSNPPSPLSSSPPLPSSFYFSNHSPSSSSSSRSSSPSSSSFNSASSPTSYIASATTRGSGSLSRVHSVNSINEPVVGMELAAAAMDLEMDTIFSPETFMISERVSRLPSPTNTSTSSSSSSSTQKQLQLRQQQLLQQETSLAREEKAKEKQATARVIHFL